MKSEFSTEDLLPLSGLQHFQFCRRQWALIHIERQWKENVLTIEGKLLHQRVDDPFFSEVRNDVIITRSMPISSYRLGLVGVCDVVEFILSDEGVNLHGHKGKYLPVPVEYKRGTQKQDACDEVQLCAQAICLEEMFSTNIPKGYFYYGENRRRFEVDLNQELRQLVEKITSEMHNYFQRGYTPKVKPSKACHSCSLADICLPGLQEKVISAKKYIQLQIDSD